jgi:hypothetical protein
VKRSEFDFAFSIFGFGLKKRKTSLAPVLTLRFLCGPASRLARRVATLQSKIQNH